VCPLKPILPHLVLVHERNWSNRRAGCTPRFMRSRSESYYEVVNCRCPSRHKTPIDQFRFLFLTVPVRRAGFRADPLMRAASLNAQCEGTFFACHCGNPQIFL
jgi:hypothetical protein